MSTTHQPEETHTFRRIFAAGALTVFPLWLTWLVVSFLFRTVSGIGDPVVTLTSKLIHPYFPGVEAILKSQIFGHILAFFLVIAFIYGLGAVTTFVAGRKLVELFEAILHRLPVVKLVYGSVKKLTTVLQEKPANNVQRVVLVDFPSPEMKAVGFVTRVFDDKETGRKLAAVYVPNTPLPHSGYLEIIPVERLTPTDWTMDQAMSFIVSGGTVSPPSISYDKPVTTQEGTVLD